LPTSWTRAVQIGPPVRATVFVLVASGPLPEQLVVQSVAVADDECFAAAERGGSQGAAAARDQSGQLGVAEPFGFHVDVPKRPSTCDVEMRCLASQCHRVPGVDGLVSSIGLLADLRVCLGKEPLRFNAAGSPLAMVVPIDPCGHERRSLIVA